MIVRPASIMKESTRSIVLLSVLVLCIIVQTDCKLGNTECVSTQFSEEYEGVITFTKSDKTCLRWCETKYLDGYRKQGNKCRNPGGQKATPWCYTNVTGGKEEWEFCKIPLCAYNETNCIRGQGVSYVGTLSKTKSGKTCQAWESDSPHSHSYNYLKNNSNYCRNPDFENAPWCYTTDSSTRWEYCDIPQCEPIKDAGCIIGNGKSYNGTLSVTKSFRTCQRWDSQVPHTHILTFLSLPENYCRNPYGQPAPWCFTTDPKKRLEACNIPTCPPVQGYGCFTGRGSTYNGTLSFTETGKTCQKWALHTPHSHIDAYNNLPENYCRNINDEAPKPWCFTTDPNTRRELCNLPICSR